MAGAGVGTGGVMQPDNTTAETNVIFWGRIGVFAI
jgi:hypothetical protein